MTIFWSNQAKKQLREVFKFYKETTSIELAEKVKNRLIQKPTILLEHPELGQEETNEAVAGMGFRYLVESHHKIVYKLYPSESIILIAAVFDTRQNPDKLRV